MSPTILHAETLDEAASEISKVDAHLGGVQIMALKAIHRLVKFEAVDPKTANIIKQEMLSRGGDAAVSKTVGLFENTKTDMIIMGTLAQYIRLIRKLRNQSFGDCAKIADDLHDLLFKNINIENADVV